MFFFPLYSWTGHLKEVKASQWRERFPERVILHAVRGMVPKTKFKLTQMQRLKVFGGDQHPYMHVFPQQPKAAIIDVDDPEIAPTLRFGIFDERAEFYWHNKITKIEPDERGFIDNFTYLKHNEPDEYEHMLKEVQYKIPGKAFLPFRELIEKDKIVKKVKTRFNKRKEYLMKYGFYENDEACKLKCLDGTGITKEKYEAALISEFD